jgi:single-strand DNA-binding protein
MPYLNKVIIIGHAGRDAELKFTPSGVAVCKFSVATSETRKGEKTTEWHNVTAFGKQAEWAGREAERQRVAQEAEAERARRREAQQARLAEQEVELAAAVERLRAKAKGKGFDLVAGAGLLALLEQATAEAMSMPRLKKLAIIVEPADAILTAQVIPGGALFRDPDGESPVGVIVKTREAIYDGTPFPALNMALVRVTGKQSYRTASGAIATAFVVTKAW